jgi:hypothetical protein
MFDRSFDATTIEAAERMRSIDRAAALRLVQEALLRDIVAPVSRGLRGIELAIRTFARRTSSP